MTDDLPPFEAIARVYSHGGKPIDEARDLVILRCLASGDATAFAYFVMAGHQPGREVLLSMAFMTTDGNVPSQISERLPFRLTSESRVAGKAGKRVDPLITMRDELIAMNVAAEMTKPGMYDSAISTVSDRIEN